MSTAIKQATRALIAYSPARSYWVKAPDAGAPSHVVFNVTWPNRGPAGQPPGTMTNAEWLFKTPDAFRKTLVWLHKRYDAVPLWVSALLRGARQRPSRPGACWSFGPPLSELLCGCAPMPQVTESGVSTPEASLEEVMNDEFR